MRIPKIRHKNTLLGTTGGVVALLLSALACGDPGIVQTKYRLGGQLTGLSFNEQRGSRGVVTDIDSVTFTSEAASRHLAAVEALRWGKLDKSIEDLAIAAELAPRDAAIQNDLAVARLERGRSTADPHEDFLALRAAFQSSRLDPKLLSAQFNLALALSRFHLIDAAGEAWDDYLNLEPDPDWVKEARSLRESLREPHDAPTVEEVWQAFLDAEAHSDPVAGSLVARAPRWFREHAEEVLLVTWGEATLAGDAHAASEALQQARRIRDLLATLHDDATLTATIDQIDRSRLENPTVVARVAQGVREYGKGLELAEDDRYEEASTHFERAEALLSEMGSPMAHWASYNRAICHYQRYDYDLATRLLTQLASVASDRRQRALVGLSKTLLAVILLIEAEPAAALGELRSASAEFEKLSESSHLAKVYSLIATTYQYLGQRDEAWRWLHRAFGEERRTMFSISTIAARVTGAGLALEEEEPEIALLFQEDLVAGAVKMGRPAVMAEALRGRAEILWGLGRAAEARSDLREAREILAPLGMPALVSGIEGDLARIEAEVVRADSPMAALEHLEKAIEVFRSTSYRYRLILTLFERAKLQIELGRPEAAEQDLAAAINEAERQRLSIQPSHRVAYFDQMRALLDTMIDLQLRELDRPDRALEFSERSRARVLWDWLTLQEGAGVSAQDLDEELGSPRVADPDCAIPPSSRVIEYAVLPDQLVIWSLEDCGPPPPPEIVEIGADVLANRIEALRESLHKEETARFEVLAEGLYELLIPSEIERHPGLRLVFVPDGPLHRLPFSLLRSPSEGRFLIRDHPVTIAPSLRILAAAGRQDRVSAKSRGSRALIVTAPAFSREDHNLPPLGAAEIEATIADLLPGSHILSGEEATQLAFFAQMREVEILHFGGHSVVNTELPLLSYLLFAPDAEDSSGVLYLGELLGIHLPSTRLVVLASCESGLGRGSKTEGIESLARPFLAAGVPAVVASLWPVEDRAAAELSVSFYRRLAEHWDVAKALQGAQVELLEQTEPDLLTAGAFVSIGSGGGIP